MTTELKSYVCMHVFSAEQPVLFVTRPDGDWCFLCGADHADDASEYRVVGINHVLGGDTSLQEVMDLGLNQEAERSDVTSGWTGRSF